MRDLEGLNSVRRSVCMSSVAATEYRPARRLLNGTNDRTAQLGLSRVAGSLSWSSGRGRIGVEAGRALRRRAGLRRIRTDAPQGSARGTGSAG